MLVAAKRSESMRHFCARPLTRTKAKRGSVRFSTLSERAHYKPIESPMVNNKIGLSEGMEAGRENGAKVAEKSQRLLLPAVA